MDRAYEKVGVVFTFHLRFEAQAELKPPIDHRTPGATLYKPDPFPNQYRASCGRDSLRHRSETHSERYLLERMRGSLLK